jgi:yeast amino acid transporter
MKSMIIPLSALDFQTEFQSIREEEQFRSQTGKVEDEKSSTLLGRVSRIMHSV